MKYFKCEVERTDKYTVEFDETVCNEEWMEEFRDFFFDYFILEEHAEHIVQHRARFGRGFIEGYGIPLENNEVPFWVWSDTQKKQVNHAINLKITSEDDDIRVDILDHNDFID